MRLRLFLKTWKYAFFQKPQTKIWFSHSTRKRYMLYFYILFYLFELSLIQFSWGYYFAEKKMGKYLWLVSFINILCISMVDISLFEMYLVMVTNCQQQNVKYTWYTYSKAVAKALINLKQAHKLYLKYKMLYHPKDTYGTTAYTI